MSKGNYIHCAGCGITYENEGTGHCPNCGAVCANNSIPVADMHFGTGVLSKKDILSVITYALGMAIIGSGYAVAVQREAVENDITSFVGAVTLLNVVAAAVLVITVVLLLLRFRLVFKVSICAAVIGCFSVAAAVLWGCVTDTVPFAFPLLIMYALLVTGLIGESRGCDVLVNGSSADTVKPSEQPMGAAMPKVQELYNFEDMPELSGMKGLEEAQPLETKDAANEDDVMDEIAPIGVAQTRSEAPVFKPSEVAPEVQPVIALTNYQAGGSITEDGENVAVTPLTRPMFEVDMMEDEAMPSIGGAEAPTEEIKPQSMPVSEESSKGIWFCSVCGNLNEHIAFCNGCGSPKK